MTRILSVFAALLLTTSLAHAAEDVFERVEKSHTLRCGYYTWPPLSQKNPKTGKMEGMYIDLTEELAKGLGWKVDWVEEVPISDFATALNANRIDMMCSPLMPAVQRIKYAYFTTQHFYGPYNLYVRANDKRFDKDITKLNDPSVTISTMEGEMTSVFARTGYPRAKVLEISSQQGATQLMENVATKKADAVFQDPFTFSSYDEHNKGVLRKAGEVGSFSVGYAVKFGEEKMVRVIDAATVDLLNRRYIEQLAKKYGLLKAGIYLPADGFKR